MQSLVLEKLDPNLMKILFAFAGFSLIIPSILAFEQQRIGRLVSYLIMGQSGMFLLLALLKVPSISVLYLHLALAIPGILAGVRFWKHTQNSDKNWEDYAGAGRKHPYVTVAWLYMLSSMAGAPFTPGFWIYLQLAHAAEQAHLYWIFALIIAGITLAMFPITRLAVFMFGKPTHYEMMRLHEPRQAFLVIACAIATAASYGILAALPSIYEIFTPYLKH
jgi:NADH-quinone oxidoreductase subunit N